MTRDKINAACLNNRLLLNNICYSSTQYFVAMGKCLHDSIHYMLDILVKPPILQDS